MNLYILVFILAHSFLVNCENTDQWLGTKLLDKNYLMFWKKDDIKEELIVRVEVRTKGWVGFGYSKRGLMEQSDLVIGWITPDGKTQFQDRWTDRKAMPVIDMSQDWTLSYSMQNSSHTVLQFHRPYKTCDSIEDIEILDSEIQNIIWAYSHTVPISDVEMTIHDIRGKTHIRLLDPDVFEELKEDDLEVFDFHIDNVSIPNGYSFFCKLFKVPFTQPRQIVKCGPRSYPADYRRFIDHTELFNLDPLYPDVMDQYVDKPFECKHIPRVFLQTHWMIEHPCTMVHTEHMYYTPSDAGVSIATSPFSTYFMMNLHLKNLNNEQGKVITHSMRIWHTAHMREKELDVMIIGVGESISMNQFNGVLIPPRQPRFLLRSVISTHCFEDRMTKDGITVDSILPHSHDGQEFYIKHYRGNQELEPLLNDVHYDKDYQVYQKLHKPLTILPGDKLEIICAFNTTDKSQILVGIQIMCLAQLIFWPPLKRNNHTYYGTNITKYKNIRYQDNQFYSAAQYDTILKLGNLEQIDGFYDKRSPIVRRPAQFNGIPLLDYMRGKKEWIPDFETILNESPKTMFCTNGVPAMRPTKDPITLYMPKNYIPYRTKYRQCRTSACSK